MTTKKKRARKGSSMDEAFSRFHPAVNFIFFIAAVVFGMFFVHPVFLVVSVVCSITYYLLIHGAKGLKFIAVMVVVFIFVTLINPVFNTLGDHVLFTYFGGRPYTLEALGYGAAIAGMFVSILVWFGCYNAIMTSDKFTYLFGRFIPSISLILTMVLRLVPNYKRHFETLSNARECIGKAPSSADRKEKVANSITLISALTSWALEGGVVTGDSMRSRGYGEARRTNFAIYRISVRDKVVTGLMIVAIAAVAFCMFNGVMHVDYTPVFAISPITALSIVGIVAYAILLAIPSAIHIMEEATWRILRSRI